MRVASAFGVLATAALIWSIASSLWYYPHCLSYFNEIVGGPEYGHEHLLDSSIAWGQDLLYLKDWYNAHPEARPLNLAAFGVVDPRIAGVELVLPHFPTAEPGSVSTSNEDRLRPPPGWYAIDYNYFHDFDRPAPDGRGGFATVTGGGLGYFRCLRPVAVAGGTIYVFQVAPDRVNPPLTDLEP